MKQGVAETGFGSATTCAVIVTAVPDQGAAITIATLTPSGKKPFTLLFRALQYNVTATSAKLAVRATAFPKTMSGRV